MKSTFLVGALLGFILLFYSANLSQVSAQVRAISCGESFIVQVARNGETQEYAVEMEANSRLFVDIETLAAGLEVDGAISAPDGFVIDEINPYNGERIYQTSTDILYQPGSYSVYVRAFTNTGGSYTLNIACLNVENGVVESASKFVKGIVCGSIIESGFTVDDEVDRYYIYLEEDTELRVRAEVDTQNLATLAIEVGITAPSGYEIDEVNPYGGNALTEAQTPILTESGTYRVPILAYTTIGGDYTFYVGCTLPDGSVVSPGDAPPSPDPATPIPQPPNLILPVTFGYPGVVPIDFSGTSRREIIPQLFGVPITSSIPTDGSGITGFSIEAVEGDVMEIDARRSQGNLGIGFVVFAEPNIPVFIAGPVSASTFSTQIELPQDGSYVIGLFRMGELPANAQATVFQITVNLNP